MSTIEYLLRKKTSAWSWEFNLVMIDIQINTSLSAKRIYLTEMGIDLYTITD